MSPRQARTVLDVLSTKAPLQSDVEWRRALKERQKTSSTDDQAALVRDMQTRVMHRRLSTQEKAYLEKAMEVLIDEMAEALGQSADEVKHAVDRALTVGCEVEKTPTPTAQA
jgi:RNA polymerase-interacting CarD/CdnL/TRCF family regulator